MRKLQKVTTFNPQTDGKVILVTGGTGALGEQVVRVFAENGWKVAFQYRQNKQKASRMISEIEQTVQKGNVHTFSFDYAKQSSDIVIEIRKIEEKMGPIYAFIHCSSQPFATSSFSSADAADFERSNQVGLCAFARTLDGFLMNMKYRQNGFVIGVLSETLLPPHLPQWASYTASKAALKSYLSDLAFHLSPARIKVLGILPGAFKVVDQEAGGTTKAARESLKEIRGIASDEESGIHPRMVANLLHDVVSRKIDYANGSFIAVNQSEGIRNLGSLSYRLGEGPQESQFDSNSNNLHKAQVSAEDEAIRGSLQNVFREVFKLSQADLVENAEFGAFHNWDSLQHINLLMSIEHALKINFSDQDIASLTSYQKILGVCQRKITSGEVGSLQ